MIMKIKLKNAIFYVSFVDIRMDIENPSFVLFLIIFFKEWYFMSVTYQKRDSFTCIIRLTIMCFFLRIKRKKGHKLEVAGAVVIVNYLYVCIKMMTFGPAETLLNVHFVHCHI